ncbi:MAG: hypothetical protein AABY79_07820 [Nitrospirota bacterium]|jgi:hypothetical protein
MISPQKEEYILTKAYIPEHIVSLMTLISKGEPLLIEDYLCFIKDNYLIFIGYPLEQAFTKGAFEAALKDVIRRHKPEYTWFIAPEMPDSFSQTCHKRESDNYYKLDLQELKIKSNLMQAVKKASGNLTFEIAKEVLKEHNELISEFLELENPSPLIRQLFLSMPDYVHHSSTAIVLNARSREGKLSAFYVVDLAAKEFAAYVIGCYSRENYVSHASDLLFYEMINLAKEHGKGYINLGLGVNEGIRRFKEKWGGVPFLRYEFCEYRRKDTGVFELTGC